MIRFQDCMNFPNVGNGVNGHRQVCSSINFITSDHGIISGSTSRKNYFSLFFFFSIVSIVFNRVNDFFTTCIAYSCCEITEPI